jgi:predicted TIM-barrel fold metal-dependent hydrolase
MTRERNQLDRRQFLRASAAATACGFAASSGAAEFDNSRLIDTHVYLGRWPLRHFSADSPAKVVTELRDNGVTQTWAGTFDGLFHKDVHGANLHLIEACREAGNGFLIPIGTVNPTLPNWEEDMRRCHETFKMPGIRLHPTYHGYALDDPRFERLLELAAKRGLLVQIVANLAVKRQRYLTPLVAHADLAPLSRISQRIRDARLLIAGAMPAEAPQLNALPNGPSTYFDFGQATDVEALRGLLNRVSADHIVYGSAAPLVDVRPGTNVLQQDQLMPEQVRAICSGNAERMLR